MDLLRDKVRREKNSNFGREKMTNSRTFFFRVLTEVQGTHQTNGCTNSINFLLREWPGG